MRSVVVVLAIVAACSSRDRQPRGVTRPPVVADSAAPAADVPGLRLPAGVTPLAYDVRLELDPDRESFVGRVAIRVRLDAPASRVWLHADELSITKARYGATALSVGAPTEHEMIALAAALPAGEGVIELEYSGLVGEEDEGLFRQQLGGKWFLYSQAEATFARRIVPCFDEPAHKVPWRVTLVVPAGQVALANAPQLAERSIDDGKRREVTFAEMPALPAHLFAVAVGPFALVDIGRVGEGRVPVRAAVAPQHVKRLGAAITWTPKLVDMLEQYIGRPLPLAKLDLVAVPRFFGAMENPGLITFEVTALVGDDKHPSFLRRHIRFLAHELAHQWFGNAVTPAWWDDLWLAEAFATWLDDKLSNALGTLDDAGLRTQLARAHALGADREVSAKPLRRPIETTDDIEGSFDAISYEKGAAVISMFEQFMGEEKFRGVVRAYVRTDRSVTARDFLDAFERADPALAKAFAGYLDKPGAPVVDVAIDCKATPRAIATPRDGASVPVCIRHPAGKACALATGATVFPLTSCVPWIVGNADGRGYYHVASAAAATAIAHLTPAEKLARGEDLAAAVARGEHATKLALADVDALLATSDPYAELAAIGILVQIDRTIAEADLPKWGADIARRLAKRLARDAVWRPRTPIDFAARDAITELVPPQRFPRQTVAKARELVERALRVGPQTIRSVDLVLAIALAAPAGGKSLFDRIANAAAMQPAFMEEWLDGLGYFDAGLAPRAVELALDRRFEPHRAWTAIGGMLGRTHTRDAAWRAVRAKLGELLATLGATEAATMIEATASLCNAAARAEVEAAFRPHVASIMGGKRALDEALAGIDQCIRASAGPTVRPAP